jgi:DnaJ-class molecular chaperone
VDPTASTADIRKAKRKWVLATHPDKCADTGAREAFELVTEASETLLNGATRRCYDAGMHASLEKGEEPRHDSEESGLESRAGQPSGPPENGFYLNHKCAHLTRSRPPRHSVTSGGPGAIAMLLAIAASRRRAIYWNGWLSDMQTKGPP